MVCTDKARAPSCGVLHAAGMRNSSWRQSGAIFMSQMSALLLSAPRAQKGVTRARWGGAVQAARSGSTWGCGGSAAMVAISRRNSATSCPSSGAAWLTTLTATGSPRHCPAYTCSSSDQSSQWRSRCRCGDGAPQKLKSLGLGWSMHSRARLCRGPPSKWQVTTHPAKATLADLAPKRQLLQVHLVNGALRQWHCDY